MHIPTRPDRPWSWPFLLALTALQLWAAHALALGAHEYAHSLTAWLLGWKQHPFALHYPHPSPAVLLIQSGVSQGVDELPIFRSGHRLEAGLISAAGAVLGNALFTLPLSRWLAHLARRHHAPGWGAFAYWPTVASIGNLLDYVPVRTFVTGNDLDQDMLAVERGFGWSPWTLLLLFGIPTLLVFLHFFFRIEPRTLRRLFPHSRPQQIFMAILTALALFCFYGAAGWSHLGPIAHTLSTLSVTLATPIATLLTTLSATTPSPPDHGPTTTSRT